MATIAMNNLPCGVCRNVGRTRYNLPADKTRACDDEACLSNKRKAVKGFWCDWCSNTGIRTIDMRTCLSCHGTLFEACSPAERGKMYAELAQYQHTKLKAIEVTGKDGGPIEHKVVEALNAGRARVAAMREEVKS